MLSSSVPGQPSKFHVGAVADISIELVWEPAYEKEGIISYELRYREGSFGTPVRSFLHTSFRFQEVWLINEPALDLWATMFKPDLSFNCFFPPPSADEEDIWTNIVICCGRAPPKHRIPLLLGSHFSQRHRSLHKWHIAEDLASQYVTLWLSLLSCFLCG